MADAATTADAVRTDAGADHSFLWRRLHSLSGVAPLGSGMCRPRTTGRRTPVQYVILSMSSRRYLVTIAAAGRPSRGFRVTCSRFRECAG